jgi:hypothetical protein
MTTTYTRERTLQDEIAPAVERSVSGVEVLAVELLSPSRFCVYIDHPSGVDHALCERVTRALDAYRPIHDRRVARARPPFEAGALSARRHRDAEDGRCEAPSERSAAGDHAVPSSTGRHRIPVDRSSGNLIDEGRR